MLARGQQLAMARLIAAREARARHDARLVEPISGDITGLVKGLTGAPYPGICVTATGPAGSGAAAHVAASHSDGRYLLAHLRPGRYVLKIADCAGTTQAGRSLPLSIAWPHAPAVVTVLPGGPRTLSPAIAWPTDQPGATTGRRQTMAVASGKAGSISGRVTGKGRPLAHICAVAIPASIYPMKPPEPPATTSKTGRYRIRGLKPGRYNVVFRTGLRSCPDDANWLPQWYPYLNSAYPPDKAANVRVRAGKNTSGIDGRLKLGGEISGIVRARAGKPIPGICVGFFTFFVVNGIYSVSVASVSRQGGRYALHGLFPGSYQVQFAIGCGNKGDYAPQWWHGKSSPFDANWIKVRGRRTVRGIDATLPPGAAITGTVRASTRAAKPLAGICVDASQNLGIGAAAVTNKNGRYRLDGLFGGKVQVSFDPTCSGEVNAGYLPAQRTVAVKAGHTRHGVNAYLRLGAGISGVVRNQDGRPVDPCVTVGDRNNDTAYPGANGRYLINGVPPGKYPVFFDSGCDSKGSLAPQWYHNRQNSGSADLVTFTAGKIDHVNVTLHPGGTVAGFLTTARGRPIGNACVSAGSLDSSDSGSGGGSGDQTSTADNGWYALTDLTPGLYQVNFGCPYGRYANQWFRSQPDGTTADYVAVVPGHTTIVSAKLRRGGSITGRVTNKAGHPISIACVNLFNARNGQPISPFDNGAMTGRRGNYQIGQLAPGRYLVQFSDCNNDFYGSQWYHRVNRESFAAQVTVRAGHATADINGVLTKGGTISGRATGPAGKPAVDMCAFAADLATGSFSSLGFVGTNGRYRVTGLSTGRYDLSIYNCGPATANLAAITRRVRVTAPRPVTGIDVKLAAGGTITGSVTGDAADPGPLGQSCVFAVPTKSNGSLPLAWTDNNGRYVISGLPAGTYRVYLADPFCDDGFGVPDMAPQWFSNRLDEPAADLVTVSAGRTTSRVSAKLRPYGGIDGRVTTGSHVGVLGECVTAVPIHPDADPLTGVVPARTIAITRGTGRYHLIDLLPGRYKVEFAAGCGDAGFITQWWPGATSAKTAQVITVSNATITKVNATLLMRKGSNAPSARPMSTPAPTRLHWRGPRIDAILRRLSIS